MRTGSVRRNEATTATVIEIGKCVCVRKRESDRGHRRLHGVYIRVEVRRFKELQNHGSTLLLQITQMKTNLVVFTSFKYHISTTDQNVLPFLTSLYIIVLSTFYLALVVVVEQAWSFLFSI